VTLRWEPLPGLNVAPRSASQRLNSLLFTSIVINKIAYTCKGSALRARARYGSRRAGGDKDRRLQPGPAPAVSTTTRSIAHGSRKYCPVRTKLPRPLYGFSEATSGLLITQDVSPSLG
jgi:hypothetical protein